MQMACTQPSGEVWLRCSLWDRSGMLHAALGERRCAAGSADAIVMDGFVHACMAHGLLPPQPVQRGALWHSSMQPQRSHACRSCL